MTIPLESATSSSSTVATSTNLGSRTLYCSKRKQSTKDKLSSSIQVSKNNSSYSSSATITKSSYTPPIENGTKQLVNSTSTAKPDHHGNVDKTKMTSLPGLPSPTDSISETSDYQRSTPSPKDEPDSGIGKRIELQRNHISNNINHFLQTIRFNLCSNNFRHYGGMVVGIFRK